LTTVADLIAGLRRRGVELLTADDGRLGVRPAGQLTPEERAALVARKAEVLALLRAEQRPVRAQPSDRWADDVPEGPCGLCWHQPLAEVRDWPVPGAARWLCLTCAVRPVLSLEAVYASLSVDERRRLLDEARAGDPLARVLLRFVPVSGAA
jgi:TubC N-terminal docking domain